MLSDNRLVIWCNEITLDVSLVYGEDGDSGTGYGDHMFHHKIYPHKNIFHENPIWKTY
jgi:hypothetical protein